MDGSLGGGINRGEYAMPNTVHQQQQQQLPPPSHYHPPSVSSMGGTDGVGSVNNDAGGYRAPSLISAASGRSVNGSTGTGSIDGRLVVSCAA